MKKIAINKCYGGFSLSHQGVMLYAKKKKIKIFAYKHGSYSSGEFKYEEYAPKKGDKESMFLAYSTKELTGTDHKQRNKELNENYFPTRDFERDDPTLIEVIEELGKKANGACADLKIVEIPDDIEWQIEEYDGLEHIAQKHSTWA